MSADKAGPGGRRRGVAGVAVSGLALLLGWSTVRRRGTAAAPSQGEAGPLRPKSRSRLARCRGARLPRRP